MDQATLKVKGIYKNGNRYSAKIRIPKDLKKHYPEGNPCLQKPLGTTDYIEAIKRAKLILEQWRKDFQRLRAGKPLSQRVLQLHPIGKDLAQAIGVADLESDVVDARFQDEAERRARDVAKKTGKSLTKISFRWSVLKLAPTGQSPDGTKVDHKPWLTCISCM